MPKTSETQQNPRPLTQDEVEALPYRLGVGLVLLNRRDRVFVAKRIDTRAEAWQMPQGGMDEGERPVETAFREMEEEIGTRQAEIIAESRDWLTYDLPRDIIPKIWQGRYRGQKQKWFLLRFTGQDSDIRIDGPHPEFSEWRWGRFAELPEMIVPFKRPIYQAIVAEFQHLVADESRGL
jgi:putative (di)nucleoside polyphosphate hydrolase|tara:strand:+ start:930 stop:1466 length:537 start_codon:yes stop_codon:yes gene_type:complete